MLFVLMDLCLLVFVFASGGWKGQIFSKNWLPISMLILQIIAFLYLLNLQNEIGCPTRFGECYVDHESLTMLQAGKVLFALYSWTTGLFVFGLGITRLFRNHWTR